MVAGHIKWNGYRNNGETAIRIEHHKTGAIVNHPLEDEDGVLFYEEAEDVLSHLKRLGIPLILHKRRTKGRHAVRYEHSAAHRAADEKEAKLPAHFTLDACRHGGMTELEEAELTEGQGRALSAHKTSQAYSDYAKRTAKRMLSGTRKRFAHRLVEAEVVEAAQNEGETNVRKMQRNPVRKTTEEQKKMSE